MPDTFAKAMRQSLALVRASRPLDATRHIQMALAGGTDTPPPPPTPAAKPPRSPRAATTRRPLSEILATLAQRPAGFDRPAAAPVTLADPPAGLVLDHGVHQTPHGARRYLAFRPGSSGKPVRGLILMLHGCTQTPEDFATGTAMHLAAAARDMIVVYPAQPRSDNPSLCWNWFRPGDQRREGGEPALLADLAGHVAARHDVPTGRIFVAGLSAGGAMAAILARTHPEVFAAAGIHSGLPTGSATDVIGAFAAMRGDPSSGTEPLSGRAIILHGSADRTVAPVNAGRLAGTLVETRERSGERNGRRYDVLEGRNASGHDVELWRIDGAGHGWSGGHPDASYTEPAGPDASAEMVRFFDRTP